jgi:TatA/E family protein of Tat protein translocase
MHAPSLWALIIIVLLVVILFARPGKISNFMTDLGKGIRGFRGGLGGKDEDEDATKPGDPPRQIPSSAEDSKTNRRDRTGVDQ